MCCVCVTWHFIKINKNTLTRAEVTEPQGRSPQVRDHKHFTLTESTLKTHAVINQFECMYLVKAVKFTNRFSTVMCTPTEPQINETVIRFCTYTFFIATHFKDCVCVCVCVLSFCRSLFLRLRNTYFLSKAPPHLSENHLEPGLN